MRKIYLAGKYSDYFMLVDEDIYEQMIEYGPWCGQFKRGAVRCAKTIGWPRSLKKATGLLAHRYAGVLYGILKSVKDPLQIDHINHNGLDNRRVNLRAVTNQENCRNMSKTKGSSRFKGVSYVRKGHSWQAAIEVNHQTRYIGTYRKEQDAALAYDAVARKVGYIESALNFPAEEVK
jgi:hypothetical protein